LQHWDYGSNAVYFVAICTANKTHYFGEVVEGKMQLSEIGRFAEQCWYEIPEHFPFVALDGFVVMPNHVHGIIVIDKPVETHIVETQDFVPLRQNQNKFGPQSQNLASIVRGYKIGVTKHAKLLQISFAWQARFHDHIIRDEDSYFRIAEYIFKTIRFNGRMMNTICKSNNKFMSG
jgi:REP element-mobilizing transposase RayT